MKRNDLNMSTNGYNWEYFIDREDNWYILQPDREFEVYQVVSMDDGDAWDQKNYDSLEEAIVVLERALA